MSFLRLLLIAVFCLMSLDIPPGALHQAVVQSCCCKSGICRCAHSHGQCPMKKKNTLSGWNKTDCGAQAQTKVMLSNSKEFLFPTSLFNLPLFIVSNAPFKKSADYFYLQDSRLKRPPRHSV